MNEEDEVKLDDQEMPKVVNEFYRQATDLWPLIPIAVVAALVILLAIFHEPFDKRLSAPSVPHGKDYSAVVAMINCVPVRNDVYRVAARTPDDEFFYVFFRGFQEPLQAGMAVGTLKYHECGKVDGQTIHCFDSFKVTHEGLPPLDQNGKRIQPPAGK